MPLRIRWFPQRQSQTEGERRLKSVLQNPVSASRGLSFISSPEPAARFQYRNRSGGLGTGLAPIFTRMMNGEAITPHIRHIKKAVGSIAVLHSVYVDFD